MSQGPISQSSTLSDISRFEGTVGSLITRRRSDQEPDHQEPDEGDHCGEGVEPFDRYGMNTFYYWSILAAYTVTGNEPYIEK